MLYKKSLKLEDRENLPIDGPGDYCIKDNKIYTRSLEVNPVRHCNLSCRGCSHCSPVSRKYDYELPILEKDLTTLSKFFRADFVRVVGGEPLLYPQLTDLLKTIKKTNVSNKICIVTNGVHLNKLTEEDMKYIDKIEISLYQLPEILRDRIRTNANELINKGIKVRILEYTDFRDPYVIEKTTDEKLIERLYNTCQIAHNWRCITVDNNRLYRCPQSMIISERNNTYDDSLDISKITSYEQILDFLEDNNAISSCAHCLGSVGTKYKHEQLPKDIWLDAMPRNHEEGVDKEYLEVLENDLEHLNDCMKRNKLN